MPGIGDIDDDVDMTVPQPIYEFIRAPRLTEWSQQALVRFARERNQYEEKIKERCRVTGESEGNVTNGLKSSLEPRILDHVAHYILRKEVSDVTDDLIRATIEKKIGAVMNGHIPDIEPLFAQSLKMDLRQVDIEARVAKYFMDFERLVEDNGLTSMMGRGTANSDMEKQRMKLRCKILMTNIQPEVLKIEVMRLAGLTHRLVKTDDRALHDLIVERATRQQQYHLMQNEMKSQGGRKVKESYEEQRIGTSKVKGASNAHRDKETKKVVPAAPRSGCWVCKGDHWLRDCPSATDVQKNEAKRQMNEKRERRADRLKKVVGFEGEPPSRVAMVNGVLEVPFCPDTGADTNFVGRSIIGELNKKTGKIMPSEVIPVVEVVAAGGTLMHCHERIKLDLCINTAAGPLHLRNVEFLILEGEDELLLGKNTLKTIGIDIDRIFEQLAERVNDNGDADNINTSHMELLGPAEKDEVIQELTRMVDETVTNGFDPLLVDELRSISFEYADVWRVRIGADEAARVEPLLVRVRPDAVPCRSGVRRYPELQRQFLREYVKELEQNGLVFRNNQSRWASAALPVRKPGSGEFRITVDYRPVNKMTVPLAGAATNLAVAIQCVEGSYGFGRFDFYKGFWQMPLHEDCQEMYSFVTEDGIFTPRRVPQGASDSAVHFQLQMTNCLRDMLHRAVLVWIDDVLIHAKNARTYLDNLKEFFGILRERRLKLNAKKCQLFTKKVKWCGKLIDGMGVQHDPDRLEALRVMPLPSTGAALQHFLCALNWLRDSMVDYSRTVAPLLQKLEMVMAKRGRRKSQLSGAHITWSAEETKAFKDTLEMVDRSNKLWFPDHGAKVCMFTDASMFGWSIVVTQVREWKDNTPVDDQNHELLICRGGMFKGAQLNWSVIEKEGYPIVKACTDLEYMLERERGFSIYCDHSNLIQIFSPGKELKQHVKGKLERWSLKLVGYRYEIHHIDGEKNVWADIVSRWGQLSDTTMHLRRVSTRRYVEPSTLRPLQQEEFVWPSQSDIGRAQAKYRGEAPVQNSNVNGLVIVDGKPWVPKKAYELIQRLLIVAHCGAEGHRGLNVMLEQIQRHFAMDGARAAVTKFVQSCLLCKHVKGGKLIQRNWSVSRKVTKRNECLHMDYLFLGESYGDARYVLVLKDELTHFCELIATDSAASQPVVEAILDWHKRFGLPEMWISDNGTHFKSNVMSELAQRLKVEHTFVPVYTPWINGTVERVNRDILQVLRVMLLELKLDTRNWVALLPLIQASLNHSPVASLKNCAPIELFTGLPASSQLDTVVVADSRIPRVLPLEPETIARAVKELRTSLQSLHTAAVDERERRRLRDLANSKGIVCNFSIGDYVLWSRIDKRIRGNKLLARWIGPFRIEVYYDSDLNITTELREHIAIQGIVLEVREIKNHRFNSETGEWQLLVAWRGLEDFENSWEPFNVILSDVPSIVKQYVTQQAIAELAPLVTI